MQNGLSSETDPAKTDKIARKRSQPNSEVYQVRAYKLVDSAPVLDGILDEEIWKTAEPAIGFLQKEPSEGKTPHEETEVRFSFDDDALYIGARMYIKKNGKVQSTLTRRDNAGISERIIITIDTYGDKRTSYSFGVTASGVRLDYYHAEDKEFSRDYSFDPVWEAKVNIEQDSWTAEMRIPFSQLRFNPAQQQVWGLNMNRYIPSENEDLYWIVIPKHSTGWASRFGTLHGIEDIKPNRRIEIIPYAAGSATFRSTRDPQNPFDDGKNISGMSGLDLKMGLGPNLTLDGTFNPDFGQVEADPAEVNLSAYETFFSERRTFFIEGSQLLRGNGPGYFYSRRIGAAPRSSASGDYVDAPKSATILGAGKISGRLASGFSLGALTALTSSEYSESYWLSSKSTEKKKVEPLTGFSVVRLQQEFGEDASTAGVMLTGVRRDLPAGDPLASVLNRQAFSGGVDWDIQFNSGEYVLRGYTGFSYVEGTKEAILKVQRSSAHYFQRPEASHVTIDSNRTSLAGYAASLYFNRNGGENWLWGTGFSLESPGLELNDIGRISMADDVDTWGFLRYRETVPGDFLREYGVELASHSGWNFGGIRDYTNIEFGVDGTWANFWRSSFDVAYNFRSISDNLTRGGPLMGTGSRWSASASLSNNYALPTRWSIRGSYSLGELGGWNYSTGGTVSFRPSGQLEFSFEPGYSRSITARQYVTTRFNGPASTFGNRYIFAFIDRTTISTRLRANYALTPDLSLEIYAEPFAASGRYYDFGELLASRSRYLRTYGTDGSDLIRNPDGSVMIIDHNETFSISNMNFKVLSFRSNLVLRWEWLRGSTLFLVWQQNRFLHETITDVVKPIEIMNTFSTPGNNFIALKLTYWLPLS